MKHDVAAELSAARLVSDPIPRAWNETFTPGLVSVVIPTYNHARFLVDAVESALAQRYAQIEVIVVDDGSTDDTPALMAPYGKRIRYIRQENRGLSGARNTGILAAQGEYIAPLDADDYWEPMYLRTAVTALKTDVSLAAIHTGMQFVDAQGNHQAQPGTATVPSEQMYDRLLDGEFFAPSAVVVRRWAFAAVGLFDLELRASEDWEMWLRISRAFRFGGIAEPLLNYRVHGNNMSSDPAHMLHYQLLTLEKQFGPFTGDPMQWERPLQRAYAAVAYFAAQGYFQRGEEETGTNYLQRAFAANPALTESIDLFYELGCVDQPLGQRGDPTTLNLERNAERLCQSLETIFQAPDLPKQLQGKQRQTYAHALRALGTLAYNSADRTRARRYFLSALWQQPMWLKEKSFIAMVAKSMIAPQMFTVLRALRTSMAT